MVLLDYCYRYQESLSFDARIIVRTLATGVTGQGGRRVWSAYVLELWEQDIGARI